MKEKKRKIHHPIRNLLIVLGVIALVTVVPVGAVFLLAYDATTNTRVYESTNITNLASKALVQGMRNTPENGKISVEINKDELNGVIVDMTSSMKIDQLKKIYVLKDEKSINFFLELEAGPLKSRLTLKTSVVDETDDIRLNIDEVIFGKLKVSKGFLNNIFKTFKIDLPKMEENGMKFDLSNWEIVLSKDIMLDSVKTQEGLVNDVFDVIEENELLSFNSEGDTTILGLNIDLGKFTSNDLLTEDEAHMFINGPTSIYHLLGADQVLCEVDSKVSYVINHANIKSEQLDPLFSFFFNGYSSLNEEQKMIITQIETDNPNVFIDAGVPKISEYKNYGDELNENAGSLLGNAEAQINFTDLSNQDVASISEEDVNNYIKSKGVIGYCSTLAYAEDGIVKDYAFFVIDNFYCNIVMDHIYFVASLNICGYDTNIVFVMEKDNSQEDKSKAYFRLATVQYGTIDGEKLKDALFNIIKDGMEGDTMVGVDKEKNLIYFNLQPVVNKIKEFDDYKTKTAEDISLDALGEGLSSNGQLKLSIH